MNGVGGLHGWRWIFILEGLLTVVVSLIAYHFIANYPATAKFLTEEERAFIHARLKASTDATRHEGFTWGNVLLALKDPKVWLYGLGYHTLALPLYTLSLFLPTIIKELGFTAAQAQLLSVPPYAFAFILTLTVAILSERLKLRAPFIMGSSGFAIIGYIILLTETRPGVAYVGTILATKGIYPVVAIMLSWPANNVKTLPRLGQISSRSSRFVREIALRPNTVPADPPLTIDRRLQPFQDEEVRPSPIRLIYFVLSVIVVNAGTQLAVQA